MPAIPLSIITHVALVLIDQFIQKEGYNWLKKMFFPKTNYKKRLVQIIYETISEFEQSHSYDNSSNKFPFYYSQILFEELNKSILFDNQSYSTEHLAQSFNNNPNILKPSENELTAFYSLFVSKINNDTKLKILYINENYKSKIFEISSALNRIEAKIDDISEKVNDLHDEFVFNANKYKSTFFEPIPDYIPRQIATSTHDEDFFTPKSTFLLYDIIVDNKNIFKTNKFILYSGAQTGKTTELRNLAFKLQNNDNFSPFLFDLNLYSSFNTFKELIGIAKHCNNALIILDAYDEIRDTNKNEFIDELTRFITEYPDTHILISSRKNFENKSNFKSFLPLYLEGLSYNDIQNYIDIKQQKNSQLFLKKAMDLEVFELLQTPFYLKEMLKYFSSHNDLPKTKSELYKILIDESFNIDEKHKQDKGFVQKLRTRGYKLLQKVAFVMTVCEKKELTEDELSETLSDEELQTIVHFSIFKRDALNTTYDFEHIAFKEFLMAELLSSMQQDDVSQLILYPDSKKLVNSLYNIVLLFLEIIQDKSDNFQSIIDVLLENNTQIIVETSPKFLTKSNRIEIFKKIYIDYKNKGLYIDYFEFRKKLMFFANYQETILFLIEQLSSESSIANYYNALVLLEYADYKNISDKEDVKKRLKDFLMLKIQVYELRNYLLLPFQNEEFANEKDIEEIGAIIKETKQPEILNDYLSLLLKLDDVDKYADWIFDIEKHIYDYRSDDGVSHSIHRDDLYDIYDKFRNTENIGKALEYLASERGSFGMKEEKVIHIKRKLLLKLEIRFLKTDNKRIVEYVLKAFEHEEFTLFKLGKIELETAKFYQDFFQQTELTESIVSNEFIELESPSSNNQINDNRELLIPILITENLFDNKMKSFDKNDVRGYHLMKRYLPIDEQLRIKLSEEVEQYFTFQRLKPINGDEVNQEDFDLVLDYQRFKEKIEFHIENKCEDIYENRSIQIRQKENIIENGVYSFFYECKEGEIINLELVKKRVEDFNYYEKFAIMHISQYLDFNSGESSIKTNKEQKDFIKRTVLNLIDKDGINLKNNIAHIVGLIIYYGIDLSEEHITNLLPFSYHHIASTFNSNNKIKDTINKFTYDYDFAFLDVLISKSSPELIQKGIVDIVASSKQYPYELFLCFASYIAKNKAAELYQYIPVMLFEKLEPDKYKELHQINMLVKIARIDNSYSLIKKDFDKLSNEAKLYYFKHLKGENKPENFCELLDKLYEGVEDNNDKTECLGILLANSCENALERFVLYLKNSSYIKEEYFFGLTYNSEEHLDLLLEALELVLVKTYNSFDKRLIELVLSSIEKIAITSLEDYQKVKSVLDNIVKKHNNYFFLNRRILTFEEKLYENNKSNPTIISALSLYEHLEKQD